METYAFQSLAGRPSQVEQTAFRNVLDHPVFTEAAGLHACLPTRARGVRPPRDGTPCPAEGALGTTHEVGEPQLLV